mgnify:FL=1
MLLPIHSLKAAAAPPTSRLRFSPEDTRAEGRVALEAFACVVDSSHESRDLTRSSSPVSASAWNSFCLTYLATSWGVGKPTPPELLALDRYSWTIVAMIFISLLIGSSCGARTIFIGSELHGAYKLGVWTAFVRESGFAGLQGTSG